MGVRVQYAHSASCARSGVFGCGGKDYSSSYGHVHEGHAVVFV
jgi:hypothetical protein